MLAMRSTGDAFYGRKASMMDGWDNPVWTALTTEQTMLGVRSGSLLRFREEIAPFCAVEDSASVCRAEDLPLGVTYSFSGAIPETLPEEWAVVRRSAIFQMVFEGVLEETAPLPEEVELTPADAEEMVRLTTLAFPGYFRPETPRMGRYVGLRVGGELIAMAGERMKFPGGCEVSGVCTHPAYTGRGYAGHLVKRVVDQILARGVVPLLHVSVENLRAIGVYERLGFTVRAEIPFLVVRRG
jgi:ribosomal protein S18 acetylase RimI-like enzyme